MESDKTWEFLRRSQLARLVQTLDDVLAIVRLDEQCAWTAQFEDCLHVAREFLRGGFTQADLSDLSYSIGQIFSASGFARYRPPAGLPAEGLHGTDNFETFTQALFDQGQALRSRVRPYRGEVEAKTVEGRMQTRIMYIERKAGELTGQARIGRVTFSKNRKTLRYRGKQYRSLHGSGFKANYYEVETGEEYWISGCHRDGMDRLYGERVPVHIDDDVREEYWTEIRRQPENKLREIANR